MVEVVECDTSSRLLQEICDVVSIMLNGEVNEQVRPTIYGASLIALKNKYGGVRLVAVRHVLR